MEKPLLLQKNTVSVPNNAESKYDDLVTKTETDDKLWDKFPPSKTVKWKAVNNRNSRNQLRLFFLYRHEDSDLHGTGIL